MGQHGNDGSRRLMLEPWVVCDLEDGGERKANERERLAPAEGTESGASCTPRPGVLRSSMVMSVCGQRDGEDEHRAAI